MNPRNHILLTIDVEDWFQVENFKLHIPFSSWDSYELRVEKNTHKLLDLLDSITLGRTEDRGQKSEDRGQRTEDRNQSKIPVVESGKPTSRNKKQETRNKKHATRNGRGTMDNGRGGKPHASFFVLGWIAKRLPNLVREIHARGHEVASHGYYHNLCNEESIADLKRDLCDSKKLLEDIIGAPVYGYRAPSFSIGNDILEIIEKCGYLYDSSFNSFGVHGRYGQMDISQKDNKEIAIKISNNFYELPISNLKLYNRVLPWGGGAYFRLIPSPIFTMGVKSILKKKKAYLFYMHPWEIDAEQPRVNEAPAFCKFRHYVNLEKTLSKFSSLIQTFKECRFITCHQYLEETAKRNAKP